MSNGLLYFRTERLTVSYKAAQFHTHQFSQCGLEHGANLQTKKKLVDIRQTRLENLAKKIPLANDAMPTLI
jgi:hypothetical protein